MCSRMLGGQDAGDSWKINPFRHDYLVINNKEIFSFQAGTEHWGPINAVWSRGRMETEKEFRIKKEQINRESCQVIWLGHEHDQYVRDEGNKIKSNPPQYGIGPQATDCQEVAADIIENASIEYDKVYGTNHLGQDNHATIGIKDELPNLADDSFSPEYYIIDLPNDTFNQDNHVTKPSDNIPHF